VCRQLSSCGALNQLQQRRMMVKDDNYITHTYAVLDARKQPISKGTVFGLACFSSIYEVNSQLL